MRNYYEIGYAAGLAAGGVVNVLAAALMEAIVSNHLAIKLRFDLDVVYR